MSIANPDGQFEREGYVQMVPPLLLPRRTPRNLAEVWLKLPAQGVISTEVRQGSPLLTLPPGSSAARVEKIARGEDALFWSTADVRGTRFEAQREIFFVLRPTSAEPNSSLRGWEWQRGSQAAQEEATRLVSDLAASIGAPRQAEGQRSAARRANECASCHVHARPENGRAREHGLANRGTDASGCFQVQSILNSEGPLETYFPLEMNTGNPFIRFSCRNGEASLGGATKHPTCADGSVVRGQFDVRKALSAGDQQARGLCAARRYLFDHLDSAGRIAFASSFVECEIS